jgi:flagellar hook-associated protein 1 FlgK
MADLSSIGISALTAAQTGLLTTEHNIANASTPGYNRQQIVQAANTPLLTGSGFMGQGVNVSTVTRLYNDFLNTQLLQQQAQSSQLSTYYTQIQQINNVIADPSAGISPSLQNFFSAVSGLANDPSSAAARQTMLSSAQSLTSSFQSLNQLFNSMNTSVNGQIGSSVNSINAYAQQIAAINQNITVASAGGTGQPPNDLLDQRDQLISQLNQEIKATVIKQTDGSYNVYIGSGQALVVGNQAFALQTVTSPSDPTKVNVSYNARGTSIPMQQSSLQGGNLGGLLAFRDQSLTTTQNALGQLATGLASTFNAQNSLGQDLNGAMGGTFFNMGAPVVNSNSNNAGTAAVSASIANATALTGSDYTLTYNSANAQPFTLTRLSDNKVTTYASLPQTVDGLTLSVSGTPSNGDSFLIRPTVNGAQGISVAISDPSRIAAAIPVISNASLNNIGNGTITAASVVNTPYATVTGGPTTAALTAGQLTLNGKPVGASVAGSAVGQSADSAYAIAQAINAISASSGVTATANVNIVAGLATSSNPASWTSGIAPGSFSINGISVGSVAAGTNATGEGANVAAAINAIATLTGVTASANATTGAVTLMAADGRDITITQATNYTTLNPGSTSLSADTGLTPATTNATLTLSSASAAGITVAGTAPGNAGLTAATTASTQQPPVNANLQQPVTVTFNNPPTTFTISGTGTGLPATLAYTPGTPISYNGWSVLINGNPSANDVFTVKANTNASSDGNNALLMAGLQTQNTMLGGSVTYAGAFAQLVSQVGSQTNQLQITSQAQTNMVNQTTQTQQSISGVNLDEEAANLIKYQQAYQAAGKAIQTANTLFSTLLTMLN